MFLKNKKTNKDCILLSLVQYSIVLPSVIDEKLLSFLELQVNLALKAFSIEKGRTVQQILKRNIQYYQKHLC